MLSVFFVILFKFIVILLCALICFILIFSFIILHFSVLVFFIFFHLVHFSALKIINE